MFVGERGTLCPVLKERKCLHLYNNFVSVKMKEKLQNFLEAALPPKPPNCIWNKPALFVNTSLCSDSFQYGKILSQSLIYPDFFTSGMGPDIFVNMLWDCIVFLIWTAWVLFDFILSKINDFKSETLLKMPPGSPSTEEFSLDIQKYINLKQAKTYLSRNNKCTLK